MSTVWILGPGEDDVRDGDELGDGDYVLRAGSQRVAVGVVTTEGVEWLEELDVSTLEEAARSELQRAEPGLTRADAQEELRRAARGVQDAQTHRGG